MGSSVVIWGSSVVIWGSCVVIWVVVLLYGLPIILTFVVYHIK